MFSFYPDIHKRLTQTSDIHSKVSIQTLILTECKSGMSKIQDIIIFSQISL